MPCMYESFPTHSEMMKMNSEHIKKLENKFRKDLNKLTLENDILRDVILDIADTNPELIPAKILKMVEAEQIKHRKEDLKRLEKTFRKTKDAERLGKVMLADPNKPLEPQLGFNPDTY